MNARGALAHRRITVNHLITTGEEGLVGKSLARAKTRIELDQ